MRKGPLIAMFPDATPRSDLSLLCPFADGVSHLVAAPCVTKFRQAMLKPHMKTLCEDGPCGDLFREFFHDSLCEDESAT